MERRPVQALVRYIYAVAHREGAHVGLHLRGHGALRFGERSKAIAPLPDDHKFVRNGWIVADQGDAPSAPVAPAAVPHLPAVEPEPSAPGSGSTPAPLLDLAGMLRPELIEAALAAGHKRSKVARLKREDLIALLSG